MVCVCSAALLLHPLPAARLVAIDLLRKATEQRSVPEVRPQVILTQPQHDTQG
jgi:hypothetical protein